MDNSNQSWQVDFKTYGNYTLVYDSTPPIEINITYKEPVIVNPNPGDDDEEIPDRPPFFPDDEPPFIPESETEEKSEVKPEEKQINVVNEKDDKDVDVILKPNKIIIKDQTVTIQPNDKEIKALIDKSNQSKDGEEKTLVIKVDDSIDHDEYNFEFSKDNFQDILDCPSDKISFETADGDFVIMQEELDDLRFNTDVVIKLKNFSNNNYPGLQVEFNVNDANLTTFEETYPIEVKIPYELKSDEDPNALIIEYIHDDGTIEIVKECKYDAEEKEVTCFINHLSKFGVNYNPVIFNDVPNVHPESGNIMFLAARNIIKPDDEGNFYPDSYISRGEYLNIITNSFSETDSQELNIQIYSDVSENYEFCPAIVWAKLNNILYFDEASMGNEFHPLNNVTREDCATAINNIAISLGLRFDNTEQNMQFSDSGMISSYATLSVERMIKAGIIDSPIGSKFFPKEYETKAEIAKTVSRLISLLQ